MEEFTLPRGIFTRAWLPRKPVAVVQIAHGMAEHSGRYDVFARFLVECDIAVYANDHRGHGRTAGSAERIGFFASQNGWDLVVQDMRALTREIQRRHPNLPLVLFGHSMGSFLAREYASRWGDNLAGLVLSGTGTPSLAQILPGLALAHIEMRLRGPKARSPLLDRLSFGRYNLRFRPNRTPNDWLSRDNAEVDDYTRCPWCGGVFTTAFFRDLFTGLLRLHATSHLAGFPPELPVLLVSGDNDPVGENGRDVRDLYFAYRAIGMRNVRMRLFEGARHELLHEQNADEAMRFVCDWAERVLSAAAENI